MILMIDNYDSFTYNLVQYLGELGEELRVYRNDQITISEIEELAPERIVISPGPGRPERAGICLELIGHFAGKIPILGVCLGHQAIASAFGGKIVRAKRLMHGKTSEIHHNDKRIFQGLKNPFLAVRYHSLAVEEASLPKDFEVSARAEDQEIMAIQHKKYPLEGVQFHPESILTEEGKKLLANFLKL